MNSFFIFILLLFTCWNCCWCCCFSGEGVAGSCDCSNPLSEVCWSGSLEPVLCSNGIKYENCGIAYIFGEEDCKTVLGPCDCSTYPPPPDVVCNQIPTRCPNGVTFNDCCAACRAGQNDCDNIAE